MFLWNTLKNWFIDLDSSLDTFAKSLLGIPAPMLEQMDLVAFVRDAIQEAYEEELDKRIK